MCEWMCHLYAHVCMHECITPVCDIHACTCSYKMPNYYSTLYTCHACHGMHEKRIWSGYYLLERGRTLQNTRILPFSSRTCPKSDVSQRHAYMRQHADSAETNWPKNDLSRASTTNLYPAIHITWICVSPQKQGELISHHTNSLTSFLIIQIARSCISPYK